MVNIYSREQQQQQHTLFGGGDGEEWVLPEAPAAGEHRPCMPPGRASLRAPCPPSPLVPAL